MALFLLQLKLELAGLCQMLSAIKAASQGLDSAIGPASASLVKGNREDNIRNGGYFLFLTIGSILIVRSFPNSTQA